MTGWVEIDDLKGSFQWNIILWFYWDSVCWPHSKSKLEKKNVVETQFVQLIKAEVKMLFDCPIEILISTLKLIWSREIKVNFQPYRQKYNKICTFNLETETVNVINNLSGKAIDALWLWVCKMRLDILLENTLWLSIWENHIHCRPSDHNSLHMKFMNLFVKQEARAKKIQEQPARI